MGLNKSKFLFFAVILLLYLNSIPSMSAQSNINYCNSVQNKAGLIRYPFGTIAVSSTNLSEIADAMTLTLRVYPCVNEVVSRGDNNEWRASVTGDPS